MYDLFDFGFSKYMGGLDEFESMSFLINVMREDDLLIDIGSNSGIYTILSSKVIGSKTYAYGQIGNVSKSLLRIFPSIAYKKK